MAVTVVVLAGGLGSRIGGDKALVRLCARRLIEYPLAAARAAGLEAVVVAKRRTSLPDLEVPVLLEPDAPTHPLLGVVTALEQLPVVIALPCDMPFVGPAQLAALALMPDEVATLWPGQPLPALYRRGLLPRLREAVQAGASLRSVHARASAPAAAPAPVDPLTSLTVNTPEQLAAAEARLRAG